MGNINERFDRWFYKEDTQEYFYKAPHYDHCKQAWHEADRQATKNLRLKNDEIKELEKIIDKIASKVSGGRWDKIDENIEQLLQSTVRERERIGELFEDHYWDSLESVKDIIMLHIKNVLANLIEQETP